MVKTICSFLISVLICHGVNANEKAAVSGASKDSASELQLNDIVVPVLLREEVQAYYSLSLTILPKEEAQKDVLIQFGPRLKDAIITDLYVILPLIWSKDEQPNLERIKSRIEAVSKKTAPDNTIGHVSINSFQLNDAKHQGLDVDKPKS